MVTISGSPSVGPGTFNYTVTLTGGCGAVTATGTITVFNCSITLTSAAGTNAQTVCNTSPVTDITYSTTGATGAAFSGLPSGVNGNWAANVVTISGTPTVAGTFNYTVTLTGGGCGAFTASGTITVNATPNASATPSTQTICSGASITPIVITGTVPGTMYNWTRNNTATATGIAASGSGDISGALTNTTTAPVTVTFTVTPQTSSGGATSINESFNTASGSTMPAGWASRNLSNPIGSNTAGWNQFTLVPWAPNTAPNHVGANFNSTGANGTISAWLFAPNVTLNNGNVLTFYTRTSDPAVYPDRLEVRMSTSGASIDAGTSSTSVGDFTTLLLSVNPTLTTTGYPSTFTQFTATLSGLPVAGVSGRIAFRYFVTNAGSSGANSDIISIDDVVLTGSLICSGPATTVNGNS